MAPCRYHNSPGGCNNGSACRFEHTSAADTSWRQGGRGSGIQQVRGRGLLFGRGRGGSSSRPSPNKAPSGTCHAYWNEGKCEFGITCRYKHDQSLAVADVRSSSSPLSPSGSAPSRLFDPENVKDIVSNAGSDSLSQVLPREEEILRTVAKREEFMFTSTRDIYKFVNALLASSQYKGRKNWSYDDAQQALADFAKISPAGTPSNGALRLAEVMRWPTVAEVHAFSQELSFQSGTIVWIMYLTSDTVLKSLHPRHANALYNVLHLNIEEVSESTARCLMKLVESRSISDAKCRIHQDLFQPESFLQIIKPLLQLFFQYITRFKSTVLDNETAIVTVTEALQAAFHAWSEDILSDDPAFHDTLKSQPLEERRFLLDAVSNDLRSLERIIRSQTDKLKPILLPALEVPPGHNDGLVAAFRRAFEGAGPGRLCTGGPRNNNDHADIGNIKVIPTSDELLCEALPFLPGNFPFAPHHLREESSERRIDVQFRLLREDFVAPLRIAVQDLKHDWCNPVSGLHRLLRQGGGRYRGSSTESTIDLNVYGNAQFSGVVVNEFHDLICSISCILPESVRASSVSKNLQPGNLICLIFPDRLSGGGKEPLYLGVISGGIKLNATQFNMPISFYDPAVYLQAIEDLRRAHSKHENMFLVEIPGLLIESIKPFLEALQSMEPTTMPFSAYIAGEPLRNGKLREVRPPLFARAPHFSYNLSGLLKTDEDAPKELTLMATDPESIENTRRALYSSSKLDPSQADAMVDCLTREVSIVEGPPGTGKSWLGIEIVRMLLNNGIKRILTVSFTNHALDQFLEHLLDGVTNNIIRIGSRSKSDRVAQYTLQTAMAPDNERPMRPRQREGRAQRAERHKVENEMVAICNRVKSLKQSTKDHDNHFTEFVQEMYPDQFDGIRLLPDSVQQIVDDNKGWTTVGRKMDRENNNEFAAWARCLDFEGFRRNAASQLEQEAAKARSAAQNENFRNAFDILASGAPVEGGSLAHDIDDASSTDSSDDRTDKQWGWEPMDEADDMSTPSASSGSTERLMPQATLHTNLSTQLRPDMPSFQTYTEPSTQRPLRILLEEANLWQMSRFERQSLLNYWTERYLDDTVPELERLREQHKELSRQIRSGDDGAKLDILRKTEVIGCTTNGAAKLLPLLQKVAPEVIIVEEAGECLEAHVLAILVQSVQQVILIGDHKQLRPHVACHSLSMDSKSGKSYRLDQSLFERLVSSIPMSVLHVQRRMRPAISNLIREYLYPRLEDHDTVKQYPRVRGMEDDVFFLSHGHPEDQQSGDHSSKTNQWEVDMVRDLVLYLLRQGYSKEGDIAILTPYLGQLARIRDSLKADSVVVSLDDRDVANLEDIEPEADEPTEDPVRVNEATFARRAVQSQVICRTVDNFQGEEATIVILSLVRNQRAQAPEALDAVILSQTARASIGFLKSANRTNVALSRAKHGMYILGNAELLTEQSDMWKSVITSLGDSVGHGFPVQCARHGTRHSISDPGTLKFVAPDGGCLELCGYRLACGHTCPRKCHPDDHKHEFVRCEEKCVRLLSCNHPCNGLCYDKCGLCTVPIQHVELPCGHFEDTTPCHRAQDPAIIICRCMVPKQLPCGHNLTMRCGEDVTKATCISKCGLDLNCRHKMCHSPCKDCLGAEKPHKHNCDRDLHCSHSCRANCSDHTECPPCMAVCRQRCPHGSCHHRCSDVCAPCLNKCAWSCSHNLGHCQLPCGQPCSRLPCDQPCEHVLPCGHPCPSICGEVCELQICVQCASDDAKDQTVDFILMSTIRDIDVSSPDLGSRLITLPCGHAFTVETLDGYFELEKFYLRDGEGIWTGLLHPSFSSLVPHSCPNCRYPISHHFARRYGRIIKRAELDVQERNTMTRLTAQLERVRDKVAGTDYASLKTQLGTLFKDSLTLGGHTSKEINKYQARHLRRNDAAPVLVPIQCLVDLRPHGLGESVSKRWYKATATIAIQYRALGKIATEAMPHVKAYESAYTAIFRERLDSVLRGELQVRDSERDAREFAQTTVGSPPPRADTRCVIEAIWETLQLRVVLVDCASTFLATLREADQSSSNQASPALRFAMFIAFVLKTSVRDSKSAIDLSTRTDATRKALISHLHLLRSLMELSTFNVGMALRANSADREVIAKKCEEAIEAARAEFDQAIVFYSTSRDNNSTLGTLNSKDGQWLIDKIQRPADDLFRGWDDLVMHAKMGARYIPVSQEEKMQIVRAMDFGSMGAFGHWFRCPKGHTFVITECGGAMEQARCPECNAVIGGSNHRLLESNTRDAEFDGLMRQAGVYRQY